MGAGWPGLCTSRHRPGRVRACSVECGRVERHGDRDQREQVVRSGMVMPWCHGMAWFGQKYPSIRGTNAWHGPRGPRRSQWWQKWGWFSLKSAGYKSVWSKSNCAYQVFDEMAEREKYLNFVKLFYGDDSNNVWHLLVVLVCKIELICENPNVTWS